MSDVNGELPANWTTATIAELCQINPKHGPKLDDALYSRILQQAKNQGYDVGAVIRTAQTP